MMTELVSAAKLGPLLTKIATSIALSAKEPAAKKIDELKVQFRLGFDAYLKKQIDRFSTVKTIIGSNRPINLLELYVNLFLTEHGQKRPNQSRRSIRDEDFLQIALKEKNIVLTAIAGAGKSMLMRYLYFQFLSDQQEKLPIFLELRDLNEYPEKDLQDILLEKLRVYINSFKLEQLEYALAKGLVALFLDGFDEIDYDHRIKRSREINKLSTRFRDVIILVSSRPSETFRGWDNFFEYTLDKFSEQQVRLLVAKIPYDIDSKNVFLRKLDSGLYRTHREFLVNPLLTLMMLITLEQFAEVPAKIHLFYEYAFEALFVRHDASKSGGFQRKRQVTLPLDDYRRLFSYFCTISYLKEMFTFSDTAILGNIQVSIDASQIEAEKNNMLADLIQCTCMIVKDGLDYVFSHRSF
jgi:predicted NACHT family NTPase